MYRNYYVPNASEFTERGDPLRRHVRAAPLEDAVLAILRHVFGQTDRVAALITKHVNRILSEQPKQFSREKLVEEDAALKKQIVYIYQTSRGRPFEELKTLIDALQNRREEIERQLSLRPVSALGGDAPEIARRIVEALSRLQPESGDESCESLRLVIASLCRNFVVNLETLEATVEVILPEFASRGGTVEFNQLCGTYGGVKSFV